MENTFKIFETLDKLHGKPCLYASIKADRMSQECPKFVRTTFDGNMGIEEEDEEEGDYMEHIGVEEFETSIIVTYSDGRPNANNEIYIFEKSS